MKLKLRAGFFVIARNLESNNVNPQVIKVPFKTNNSTIKFYNGVISTSNSEQKEQTNKEKYVFYCNVSQIVEIHINPEKT